MLVVSSGKLDLTSLNEPVLLCFEGEFRYTFVISVSSTFPDWVKYSKRTYPFTRLPAVAIDFLILPFMTTSLSFA